MLTTLATLVSEVSEIQKVSLRYGGEKNWESSAERSRSRKGSASKRSWESLNHMRIFIIRKSR